MFLPGKMTVRTEIWNSKEDALVAMLCVYIEAASAAYVHGGLACLLQCHTVPFYIVQTMLGGPSTSCIAYCSEELDAKSLKFILGNFAPRMGTKWDFIGIQLRQGDLVQDLRSLSSTEGSANVQRIIEAWFENADQHTPVCAETVLRVLKSTAVGLGAVAKDFEKVRWPSCICMKRYVCHNSLIVL